MRTIRRAAAAAALVGALAAGTLGTVPRAQAADATGASAVAAADPAAYPLLPSDDPFYLPPSPVPAVAPGTVLRSRAVTVRGLGLPLPVSAWQVLYRSTDAQGRPNAVSGTVAVLQDGRPAAGRPLVAYNIGTHGLASQCAPSYMLRLGVDPEEMLMGGVLARGWAIVVTDYEGLGTPGPHTYTSGPATGHAVLDGARAALRLPEAGLGRDTRVGIWGYSEGGLASTWAAELAPTYAPDLDVRGTAAGGVPADLSHIGANIDGGPLAGFLLAAAVGLDRANPGLRLGALLNDEGKAAAKAIAGQCVAQWTVQFAYHRLSEYTRVPNPLDVPRVAGIIARNRLGGGRPAAPMHVYESVNDEFIPVADVRELVRTYCGKGVVVQYTEEPMSEHISAAAQGSTAALDWLGGRFAGAAAPNTCGVAGAGRT
jgi:hypothetical protein